MSEHRYLHSDVKDDVELGRLSLQASILDPVTIRHLETVGVAQGWKCLEVGAGTGSIAQWLLGRVGPTGRVVATDINTRFLNRLSVPNLEVRRHDILKDELEKAEYDLVHCRLLLVNLPSPEKALKHMSEAVRAGGWLLVEENDYGPMMAADADDPSASAFAAACKASNDFVRKKGIADPLFGRKVRGLVEGLGYEDVCNDGFSRINRGGDPMAQVDATTWLAGVKGFRIPEGDITWEEAEKTYRMFLDPTFYYTSYTMFSAWGRKPVGGA
jgi:SAM-dependent methyltransferase